MKRLQHLLAITASFLLALSLGVPVAKASTDGNAGASGSPITAILQDSIPTKGDTISTETLPQGPISDISYSASHLYRIAGIKVVGGKGFDEDILLSLSRLNVGDLVEIPGPAISDAIRRYMRNGYFKNVVISVVAEEGEKVWLEILLEQRPKVTKIAYRGVKKSEREDLEKKLGLQEGVQLSPHVVDKARELAIRYFKDKGYSDVDVQLIQQPDLSNKNAVSLQVVVDKQSKIKVSDIYFVGNKHLTDSQLRAAMKKTNELFNFSRGRFFSSWKEIFSSKKFVEKEYKEDLNNILKRYHEAGYRDAEIVSDTIRRNPQNPKRLQIKIALNEGEKYHIGSIRFVGNTKYSSEYLTAVLGIKEGEVYNQKKLAERITTDDDAVSNVYYNNGYIFARIDPVETAIKNDTVDLDLRIIEGPQATINKVVIKGNDLLYENVIRRELYTKPGNLFSRDDLMSSFMALNRLDLFDPEKSVPKPVPNPQDGTVDIEYDLTPKRSDKFEFSFGWSQAGVLLRLGVKFTNFSVYNLFHPDMYKGFIPQGDGQTLSIDAMTNGRYFQQYSIQFIDPWFGGKKPNHFAVSLFYSRQTALDLKYYNQQIGSYGYGYGYGYNPYGYGGYGYNPYGGYGGYGYDNSSMLENAYNPNQSLNIIGASVGFGKRLEWPDNWFQIYASLNYNLYILHDWVYDTFQGFHDGRANDLSLTLRLSRVSVDNPIYTRRGSDFSLSASLTPPYSLFDKVDYADPRLPQKQRYRFIEYHKWRFSGKVFTPLISTAVTQYTPVLMTRFDMGFIGHYNRYKLSPFGTYYMGGDAMGAYGSYMNEVVGLRGYRNGSIAGSNYNYGYAFIRTAAELRVPILFQGQTNIWALAFVEAGNAWQDIANFNPFHLKRSAGVGVRVTLPIVGLIGVDWGYGFDKPDGSSARGGSNVHFVMGAEF